MPRSTDANPAATTYRKARASLIRFFIVAAPLSLLIPAYAQAGVFDTIFGFAAKADTTEQTIAFEDNPQTMPLLRGVLSASQNALGGGDIMVNQDGSLIPSGPDGAETDTSSGEISQYIVRENDSLSEIAEMFGVSVNTILWANDIKNPNTIKPGDTLVILPVSSVRHIVKKGDSLKSIATKYHGDVEDIAFYNRLTATADLEPGTTVVIPGGEVVPPPAPPKKKSAVASSGVKPALGGSSYLINPLPGAVRTQGIHGYNGVDLAAPVGTPMRAAAAGTVILARSGGYNGGYGSYVVIKHPNGTQTLYAHMSRVDVVSGQSVSQGETIGAVGNTGRSTGPHLHFEVRGAKNPF